MLTKFDKFVVDFLKGFAIGTGLALLVHLIAVMGK